MPFGGCTEGHVTCVLKDKINRPLSVDGRSPNAFFRHATSRKVGFGVPGPGCPLWSTYTVRRSNYGGAGVVTVIDRKIAETKMQYTSRQKWTLLGFKQTKGGERVNRVEVLLHALRKHHHSAAFRHFLAFQSPYSSFRGSF